MKTTKPVQKADRKIAYDFVEEHSSYGRAKYPDLTLCKLLKKNHSITLTRATMAGRRKDCGIKPLLEKGVGNGKTNGHSLKAMQGSIQYLKDRVDALEKELSEIKDKKG